MCLFVIVGALHFSSIYALFASFFWSTAYFVGVFATTRDDSLSSPICTIVDFDLIFGIYCDLPYMHHPVVGRPNSMLHWAWFS